MKYLDVPSFWSFSALLLASAGLILSFSIVNIIAAYCMCIYALFPTLVIHEMTALVLAGFVLDQASGLPQILFGVSYVMFLTSVRLRWLQILDSKACTNSTLANNEEQKAPPISVDDI